MKPAAAIIAFCLSLGVAAPAWAVYKCESGGAVSYNDLPCDGGKALELNTAPLGEGNAANHRATQEKSQLQTLERERHRREAAEARDLQKAAKASAARRKKCATYARRLKWENEDAAKSTGIANEKAKRKAQRITEEYETACGRWYERELSVAR